ncbi:hypothetical protein D3C87_1859820 [compost metagenome]
MTARHEIVRGNNIKRFCEMNSCLAAQNLLRLLHNLRIRMNRIDELHVLTLFGNACNGFEHFLHGIAPILSSVHRHEDPFAGFIQLR